MAERPIKIAAWNICGSSTGVHSWGAVQKINAFQWKIKERNKKANQAGTLPDIAFYLEAPEGKCEALPGIDSERWKKTYWVGTGVKENPRGILAVQYETKNAPTITRVENSDKGRTGIGVELSYGEKRIRVIGVWTTPPHSGGKFLSQEDYFEELEKILESFKAADFLVQDIPCIVVGDFNLNLSARKATERNDFEEKRKF